jgi:hypothetical protein
MPVKINHIAYCNAQMPRHIARGTWKQYGLFIQSARSARANALTTTTLAVWPLPLIPMPPPPDPVVLRSVSLFLAGRSLRRFAYAL